MKGIAMNKNQSRRNNFSRWVFVVLFLVGQHIALPQTTLVRSLVSRYIASLQRRDFRTIVALNDDIRVGEASIQVDNPKLLWAKLICEYRQKRVRELKGEEKL